MTFHSSSTMTTFSQDIVDYIKRLIDHNFVLSISFPAYWPVQMLLDCNSAAFLLHVAHHRISRLPRLLFLCDLFICFKVTVGASVARGTTLRQPLVLPPIDESVTTLSRPTILLDNQRRILLVFLPALFEPEHMVSMLRSITVPA